MGRTDVESARTGYAEGIGAAIGLVSAIDTTQYGVEHSVAVSLALRELQGRLGEFLRPLVDGGDIPCLDY
jgi:hypothetical protein